MILAGLLESMLAKVPFRVLKLFVKSRYGDDHKVVDIIHLKRRADDPLLFKNVKRNIQEHYNSKGSTWIAESIDTYFNSPWSLTTLIVTVFHTFLTIVHTYYGSPFYHSFHE
ncbi:hypothetical protein RDI58_010369 [Solanum bulbocastanum]|uniref:Uncharacterized protein n=1 Tax=Solanum bulbocastanum TaxID=147425 RepID=A0AAN8TUT9_SOLBU